MAGKIKSKKINPKKSRKAQWAWLEQVYFKIDTIEKRLDALEETVKFISDEIQKLQDDRNGHREKT
jgi:cell division protein FtsB